MNKTEIKRAINKEFYEFIEEKFPNYIIDDNEGYGRIYLVPEFSMTTSYDSIEYHQSRHTLTTFNGVDISVSEDCEVMEERLKEIIKKYENE